ncbi:MAG TPA: ornithine carbamoyltransferase [Actinomycetota bacterium]|nr:ornithine carbamoyltransferase [Actinomycetota bacterium]
MRHLLRTADLRRHELTRLLTLAVELKADPFSRLDLGRGRSVAILFEKPSLRTRFSLESALARLGAHPIGAYDQEVGVGTREPVTDVGRVLDRYVDAVVMRTFAHMRLEELASVCETPVVNALSDAHHPLQSLADLMTVAEACCASDPAALSGVPVAYVGDGNNVAHSLIEACALAGMPVRIACPPGYEPDPDVVGWAQEAGGEVLLTDDPMEAARGAAAVYTDVWASMGREHEAERRRALFEPYRVTRELMGAASPEAVFLHCLPAHRGDEVTAEVIDGPASRVWDQAENRLHTAAAVFATIFGGAS